MTARILPFSRRTVATLATLAAIKAEIAANLALAARLKQQADALEGRRA